MRRPGVARAALLPALLAAAGCGPGGGDLLLPSCRAPELLAAEVAALPDNVLGAVARVRVRSADSIGLSFGLAGGTLDSVAPAVLATSDSALVPVLGLLPGSDYVLRPVLFGRCTTVLGPELRFSTGPLPVDLPSYRTGGTDPSPGYVVLSAMPFGLVIDNTGRVVWYHRFPVGTGLNFQVQANGHYVARPPAGSSLETRWIEIDPLGALVRTFGCAHGLSPRFHDLVLESDGSYWTMCDEPRTLDLSADGGFAQARVTGTAIQHISNTGDLLFEWSPFDHFAITDLPASARDGREVNWTHGNALDLDEDGNLIVSFRSLNEITRIDTRTGAVLWRMGGLANQFTWQDTPAPAFSGQHGLRATGAAEFLLLDNLGQPDGSRAERYVYDAGQHTARLLRSYGGGGVVAQLGGTTQSLPGGHILVAFGNGGRLVEYDADGNVVWRIEGDAGYVFRAQRIRSLYHPGVGGPR